MKAIESVFDRFRPLFEKGGKLALAWPVFELGESFLLTPASPTTSSDASTKPKQRETAWPLTSPTLASYCGLTDVWPRSRDVHLKKRSLSGPTAYPAVRAQVQAADPARFRVSGVDTSIFGRLNPRHHSL